MKNLYAKVAKIARPTKKDGCLILGWEAFQASVAMFDELTNGESSVKRTSALYSLGKEAGLWKCSKPADGKETVLFVNVAKAAKVATK